MDLKNKIASLGDLSKRSDKENIKFVKYNRGAILNQLREEAEALDYDNIYDYMSDSKYFELDSVFIADGLHNSKSKYRDYVYVGIALLINK
jgi:hypothetical protein